jgi:hypothetical protein
MIITLPAQTAVWLCLPSGAPTVVVKAQLSVAGLYLPPVLFPVQQFTVLPPQMIISLPLQTTVWLLRAGGAPAVFVPVQVLVEGL